jgi:uncharacterized protein
MLTSLVLGVFIGTVLGLTGAGGGILAVPALVVGFGWSMQQAAPVALIAVAGGASIGAIEGFRRKMVRYRAAALMALAGIPVTGLGVRSAHAVPQRVLLMLFAAIMLLVGLRLLAQAFKGGPAGADLAPTFGRIDLQTGRFLWTGLTALLLAGIGALTGFMTGLLGVGGGFVIVPLLRRFTALSMHGIVATSLLVIAIVGISGVLAAVFHGAVLPPEPTLLFTAATAVGMLAGRFTSHRLSPAHVQIGFGIVVLAVALGLLLKAALDV